VARGDQLTWPEFPTSINTPIHLSRESLRESPRGPLRDMEIRAGQLVLLALLPEGFYSRLTNHQIASKPASFPLSILVPYEGAFNGPLVSRLLLPMQRAYPISSSVARCSWSETTQRSVYKRYVFLSLSHGDPRPY